MKKFSKVLIVTMALTLVMAFMPTMAFADDTTTTTDATTTATVKVTFTASTPSGFDMVNKTITATSDLAETYFPAIAKNEVSGQVSMLDVLVAAHIDKYGEVKFKADPTAYMGAIDSTDGTSMTKQFGHKIVGIYTINNAMTATGVSAAPVKNGQNVKVCSYADSDTGWTALMSYFNKETYSAKAGKAFSVKITAAGSDPTTYVQTAVTPNKSVIQTVNTTSGALKATSYKTNTKGIASVKFSKPGTYYISAKGTVTYTGWAGKTTASIMAPLAKVKVGLSTPSAKTSAKTKSSVKISWKKITGASKYKVYRATKKTGTYKCVKTTTKLSLTNKGLKKGQHYYYKVKAVNGSHVSAFSKVVVK